MRYIKIEDAVPGMRLAYNLYDVDGHTLICSGSVLSKNYVKRLNDYGFDGVYIEDELSKDTNLLRRSCLFLLFISHVDYIYISLS